MRSLVLGALLTILAGCKHPQPTRAPNPQQKPVAASSTAESPRAQTIEAHGDSNSDGATQVAPSAPVASQRVVKPFDGITVDLARHTVAIQAWTCLDAGYLEQIACGVGSREHESLLVIKAKPSQVHAAMLLAGFEPGSPGKWTYENNTLGEIAPTGERLDVLVRCADPAGAGRTIEVSIREWIRDANSDRKFPDQPWVFGGSAITPNQPFMGPGEHYVADMTGSIIGLVTFGDEVVGYSRVISDQDAVQAPEWEVDTDKIPPVGTEVTLILRKRLASP